jgi:DNA-binding XRE family transcriptional regulator
MSAQFINQCIEDMRTIARSGSWTLEAQVRAYDLLELLCDHAIEGEAASHFCKEYDALAPEYDIIQAMIDARKGLNITQKELSERTGITQADISRIENGTRNPSLNMMKRLAEGMGMVLKLEFVQPDALAKKRV